MNTRTIAVGHLDNAPGTRPNRSALASSAASDKFSMHENAPRAASCDKKCNIVSNKGQEIHPDTIVYAARRKKMSVRQICQNLRLKQAIVQSVLAQAGVAL